MKRTGSRIFIIDVDESNVFPKDITDQFLKEDLLYVSNIIINTSHERTTISTGVYYEIQEKILDDNKNLFLIAKSKSFNFQRKND